MKLFNSLRNSQRGFTHVVLPALIIAAVAAVGTIVLEASHADTPSYPSYLRVSNTSVNTVLSRGNPANLPNGLIYGNGITITGLQNTSFELYNNQHSQGVGFYTVSGGLSAGQSDIIQTYVNPSKANGTYTGTYTLKYYVPSSQQWFNGPLITYTINLVNSYYTDYVRISNLSSTVTLSKANAATGALLFAQEPEITGVQNTSFELKYTEPTQGVGFYTSSGGLIKGQSDDIETYVNSSKPDGTYSGEAILEYVNSNNQWSSGPVLSYTVKLVN